MSHCAETHIKIAYFYLMFYVIPRAYFRSRHSFSIFYTKSCSRATRVITNLILSILVLNFLLIGIINPVKCLNVKFSYCKDLILICAASFVFLIPGQFKTFCHVSEIYGRKKERKKKKKYMAEFPRTINF